MGLTGLFAGAAVLVAALGFGLFHRSRAGKLVAARVVFDFASLGVRPGRVKLLQFSSAFCAPCRAVRVRCASLASSSDVDHVEVDAESHLDAVRSLNVWKTPTLFIIDASGNVAGRIQGVPTLEQLRSAIGVVHA